MPQCFKGDDIELKISGSGSQVFAQLLADITAWFNDAYNSAGLGEILYDNNLTFLTQSISRDIFIKNYGEILRHWEYLGSFESYYIVLRQIFGPSTQVRFERISPGALKIDIAAKQLEFFKWLMRVGKGRLVISRTNSQNIYLRAAAGITHFYEVQGILNSLIPAGIYVEIDFRLVSGD